MFFRVVYAFPRAVLQIAQWAGNAILTENDLSTLGTRHLNGYIGVSFKLEDTSAPIAITHIGVYAAALCSNTKNTQIQIDFWDVTIGELVANSFIVDIERPGELTVAQLGKPIYVDSPDTYAITMYDSSHGLCKVRSRLPFVGLRLLS